MLEKKGCTIKCKDWQSSQKVNICWLRYPYYKHISASGYGDVKFFADALKEEEGLKNHGYAKKGKLDLKKWKSEWKYQRQWQNAEIEGYEQICKWSDFTSTYDSQIPNKGVA